MDKPRTTPKDFFLWAGAMIGLYGSAIAFLALVFDYLNYAMPDTALSYSYDPYQGGVSYEMSVFIILGALCLVLMWVIHRGVERDPTRAEIWVRRWALYLTLFVAGATIVGDLVTLLTTFFNGEEITTRFLLKVLLVLCVAAAGFMHFWADLRGYWQANPGKSRLMSAAVGLLGILTIMAGFFIIGTPWQARQYRIDEQRVSDLSQIQSQIVTYWQQKQKLPAKLSDLNDSLSYSTVPTDPQTHEQYVYQSTGALSFKLCASFNAASRGAGAPGGRYPMPASYGAYGKALDDNWQHGAGQICFDRTIDPQRYGTLRP